VFVTAACENLARGKPEGARRQFAKALQRFDLLSGAGAALGLTDEAGFVAGVRALARAAGQARNLADLPSPPPKLSTR
jgi:hypothetical protein